MFRCITVALVGVAAWGMVQAATAEPTAPGRTRAITLEEAVTRALDASATIKSRDELVGGAEAGVRQSGVLPNPEIEAELENFAGSGPFNSLDEAELTLGVLQRIEPSGKRDGRVAVAKADRDIAAIERDKARLDIALEARRAYFEVCAAVALLDAAQARLTAATQVEAMAVRRVRAARDPITVKLRAEIQSAEARGARDRAVLSLDAAKRKLASLWGDPSEVFTADTSALFAVPAANVAALPDAPPDLKASEAAARRAASRVALENANAGSDVSVGLGVRRFENGGDLAGVVSVSVPLAIFDSNQGNIERAAAERRAADLDVIEARRTLDRDALALQSEITRSRAEAITIRSELLPRAEEALRAARRGYDQGAFSYLELSESQRTLNELRTREVEVLRDLHFALAALDRLSGRIAVASTDQGQQP